MNASTFLNTLRLWAAVFVSNVGGAVFFGWLVMKTGALSPNFADALADLGLQAANGHFTFIFAKGIIGGWLIALVAWMVSASHWTIGQIAVTWMLTFIVGAGHFSHCIASSAEIIAAIMSGHLHFSSYFQWLLPATLGNVVGGVSIVSLLNFGQVRGGKALPKSEVDGFLRMLCLLLCIRASGCIIELSLTLFFEALRNGNLWNRGDTRAERSLYAAQNAHGQSG